MYEGMVPFEKNEQKCHTMVRIGFKIPCFNDFNAQQLLETKTTNMEALGFS
jgi:hypothetical protein